MSRKVCGKCGSMQVKIETLDTRHRIVCMDCGKSTAWYETISEAWHDWATNHQKKLSFICECGQRCLTSWRYCPECGEVIPREKEEW